MSSENLEIRINSDFVGARLYNFAYNTVNALVESNELELQNQ